MAQVREEELRLGSGPPIATLSVDGGGVRGEGGAERPQLVVPLKIVMDQQPEQRTVAVVCLQARLTFDQHPPAGEFVCKPIWHAVATE